MEVREQADRATRPERSIQVRVHAPGVKQAKKYEWERKVLVRDAAAQAATDFGYRATDPTFQDEEDVVLERDKTLGDAGVRNGDTLELVDVGGGV